MSVMRDFDQSMRDALGVAAPAPFEQKGPSMFGKVFNSFLRQQQMMQNFKQNRLSEMEQQERLAQNKQIEEQVQRSQAASRAQTSERRRVASLDFSNVDGDGYSL